MSNIHLWIEGWLDYTKLKSTRCIWDRSIRALNSGWGPQDLWLGPTRSWTPSKAGNIRWVSEWVSWPTAGLIKGQVNWLLERAGRAELMLIYAHVGKPPTHVTGPRPDAQRTVVGNALGCCGRRGPLLFIFFCISIFWRNYGAREKTKRHTLVFL